MFWQIVNDVPMIAHTLYNDIQFSQFEIAFSALTMCICVCLFQFKIRILYIGFYGCQTSDTIDMRHRITMDIRVAKSGGGGGILPYRPVQQVSLFFLSFFSLADNDLTVVNYV